MSKPEDSHGRYPITNFEDFAGYVVGEGIAALAYLDHRQQEFVGRVDVARPEDGSIRSPYDLPVGLIRYSTGSPGYEVRDAVGDDDPGKRRGLTIDDFVAGELAVRPVSWDDVEQCSLQFSYQTDGRHIPSADERAILAATKPDRMEQFDEALPIIEGLIQEARRRYERGLPGQY